MSSAYNTLAFRIALGDDLVQSPGPFLTSSHPSVTGSAPATGSFVYENGPITEIYSDAFIINSSSVEINSFNNVLKKIINEKI